MTGEPLTGYQITNPDTEFMVLTIYVQGGSAYPFTGSSARAVLALIRLFEKNLAGKATEPHEQIRRD